MNIYVHVYIIDKIARKNDYSSIERTYQPLKPRRNYILTHQSKQNVIECVH